MARRKKQKKEKRKRVRTKQEILNRALSNLQLKNYMTDEFMPIIMETEIAIHESFVATRRELSDRDVRRGLRNLIHDLRTKGYESLQDELSSESATESGERMMVWNIMRRWMELFGERPPHNDTDLAGCLGTTLGSIKTWATPWPDSRGFLYYLEGFLTSGLGLSVRFLSQDGKEAPEKETDESELLALAKNWLKEKSPASWREFSAAAEKLIRERNPGPVIHICQYIIGTVNDISVTKELMPLMRPAFRQMGIDYGARSVHG